MRLVFSVTQIMLSALQIRDPFQHNADRDSDSPARSRRQPEREHGHPRHDERRDDRPSVTISPSALKPEAVPKDEPAPAQPEPQQQAKPTPPPAAPAPKPQAAPTQPPPRKWSDEDTTQGDALAVFSSVARRDSGASAYQRLAVTTGATDNIIAGGCRVDSDGVMAGFSFTGTVTQGMAEPGDQKLAAPISGTPAANTYDLHTGGGADTLDVTLRSTDTSFASTRRNVGIVNTGGGNDSVTVHASGINSEVYLATGTGDDHVDIASNGWRGEVIAGDGNDVVKATTTGTFSATMGSGNDIVTVDASGGTRPHYSVDADGGDGNDTITVNADSGLNNMAFVHANGGSGNDTIKVSAQNQIWNGYYSVDGGTGDDIIDVEGGAGVSSVAGGDGNDVITVSGDRYALIDGGVGKDNIDIRHLNGDAHLSLSGDTVKANGASDLQIGQVSGASVVELSPPDDGRTAKGQYIFETVRYDRVKVSREGSTVTVTAKDTGATIQFRNVDAEFEKRLSFAPPPLPPSPPPQPPKTVTATSTATVVATRAILATQATATIGTVGASSTTAATLPVGATAAATASAVRVTSAGQASAMAATKVAGDNG